MNKFLSPFSSIEVKSENQKNMLKDILGDVFSDAEAEYLIAAFVFIESFMRFSQQNPYSYIFSQFLEMSNEKSNAAVGLQIW